MSANDELPMRPGDVDVTYDRDGSEPGAKIKSITGMNKDGTGWTLSVGDRVEHEADECDPDTGDTGRISGFRDARTAVVYWDSGVETPCHIDLLTHDRSIS